MSFPFSDISETNEIRNIIYNSFNSRNDVGMELIDALSSGTKVDAPIELSQSHHFTRQHSSISQSITQFITEEAMSEALKTVSIAVQNHLDLFNDSDDEIRFFALDETGIFKPCAKAMDDRGHVHGCSKTHGAIGVGHSYSYLVGLSPMLGNWVIPINKQRVATSDSGITLGLKQFRGHVESQKNGKMSVLTADSKYSTKEAVNEIYETGGNTLLLTRLNSVRNLYFPYTGGQKKIGMDKEYGDIFQLHDDSTWSESADSMDFDIESVRGKKYKVKLTKWEKLIMSGSNEIKMHDRYFDIVRVLITNEAGESVHHKCMWLMLAGENRDLLSMRDIFERYTERFKIEHFFRFSKQQLLLGKYQTPDTETQNKWCDFSALAYLNLLSCSGLANSDLVKPWQKGMQNKNPQGTKSPSQTKRMFDSISAATGTPATACNYVQHGDGRKLGTILEKRGKKPVIRKSEPDQKSISVKSKKQNKKSDAEKIKKASEKLTSGELDNLHAILVKLDMIEKTA